MPVYTCKLELKNEREVVYHDIFDKPRPGEIRVTDLHKQLLSRFNQWVSSDKLNEREDLELLGLCLYELVFPLESNTRAEFESNYDLVTRQDQQGSRLRLTLVFHEAAGELANYPWEFLFMPPRPKTQTQAKRNGFFLAGQMTQLILTRFMPNVEHTLGEQENELRILLVFSNPDSRSLDPLNTPETLDAIAKIKGLEQAGSRVRVKEVRNPTYEELRCAINEPEKAGEQPFKPHIIHFIGHGDKKLGLALQMTDEEREQRRKDKAPREAAWCDRATICDLFSEDPPPRLVFLHACEGAKSDTLDGFSDLARELVAARVPAVIAMQYAIKPGDAAVFAKEFYEQVGAGSDIDEAVRKGRAALGLAINGGKGSWSDKRFGTPVVYLQSEKPIISMPAREPKDELGYDPKVKIPCPNRKCDSVVLPDDKMCVVCEHEVVICPQCLKEKHECHMIDKTTKGICVNCLYRIGGRALDVTPGALSTSGSLDAQQPAPLPDASPAALAPTPSVQTANDAFAARKPGS